MVISPILARTFSSTVLGVSAKTRCRPAPTLALVELDPMSSEAMRKAFAECGVKVVDIGDDFGSRIMTEKFEGCALRLDERAASILEAVRSSPSNRRMIVYGIGSEDLDVRTFSKYGVNAILDQPIDRAAAVRTARSTCALLLQELRRYVRVPLVIDVTIDSLGGQIRGSSREVSGGGMSIELSEPSPKVGKVLLRFSLPGKPLIKIRAAVCWKQGSQFGFQFEDSDPNREIVKSWIDGFLGLQ